MQHSTSTTALRPRLVRLFALLPLLMVLPFAGVALAQTDTAADTATVGETSTATDADEGAVPDETLILGADVYSQVCSACHQPGGTGVAGQFPPLLGNPNVADTAYVVETIANGREGEITVLGETYNGRMPAFSTLPDEEVDAVVAYIQSGFQAPTSAPAADGGSSTVGTLPGFTDFSKWVAYAIAGGVALLVLAPRITSVSDDRSLPWLDAWLKSAIIVVGFVVFTVLVPSWVLQSETVSKLDRLAQDIIGTGLWLGALAAGIWALWYASRERHI